MAPTPEPDAARRVSESEPSSPTQTQSSHADFDPPGGAGVASVSVIAGDGGSDFEARRSPRSDRPVGGVTEVPEVEVVQVEASNFEEGHHHDVTTDESRDGDESNQDRDEDGPVAEGGMDGARARSVGAEEPFSDIAQAAARAVEDIDMDRLCSELFAQEQMLTPAELEEALAGASGGADADLLAGPSWATAGASCHAKEIPAGIAVPSKSAGVLMALKAPPAPSLKTGSADDGGAVPAPAKAQTFAHALPLMPPAASSLQFSKARSDGVSHAKKQRADGGRAVGTGPNSGAGFPPGGSAQASNSNQANNGRPRAQGEHVCAKCRYPGADVRFRCPHGCAFHARCMDLAGLCRDVRNCPPAPGPADGSPDREVCARSCPHCARPCSGMEILPLSFAEMDCAQENARAAFANSGLLGNVAAGSKRPRDAVGLRGLPTAIPAHSGAQPPRRKVQCYDPSQPRIGRWSDEEILFRDTLICHFIGGSLPLANGIKLNDFLPTILKSKQSRLAKKMKHAKLSTKYFYPKTGCLPPDAAVELSRLESAFVGSIPDPIERSEVSFHMSREWREHFADRCHALSVAFDGRAWLGSVEDMERRLAFEKERQRLVKRRFMMGKAMEKDCDGAGNGREQGVFVNHVAGGGARDGFELQVEKSVANSAGTSAPSSSGNSGPGGFHSVKPTERGTGHQGVWSSGEPNFKHAAPFLAGIASYVERKGVPFEHVDVWVPSLADKSGAVGKRPTPAGGRSSPMSNFRLCFGGSVTLGVQLVSGDGDNGPSASPRPQGAAATRRVPLTADDKSRLSFFGDYSEKFSFDSGCGLPGRIFKSGVPAWDRFVSEAHPKLFERRGGAAEFGVRTAVGLPVDSPNVGRVVVVLYSKHDRPKDEGLVGRMMSDLRLLNPCPRWKLVVDVDGPGSVPGGQDASSSLAPPPANGNPFGGSLNGSAASSKGATGKASLSNKERQIKDLILLMGENMPSDTSLSLGPQLQGIMSLRLILLRGGSKTQEEEHLVDTVLVLFESYLHAGRSRKDIALMVARDFTFHLNHQQSLSASYSGPTAPVAAEGNAVRGPSPPDNSRPVFHAPAPSMAPPMAGTPSPLMAPVLNVCGAVRPPAAPVMGTSLLYANAVMMGTTHTPMANPLYGAHTGQLRSQPTYGIPRQHSFASSPRSNASR